MYVRGAQVLDLGPFYIHTRFHSLSLGTSGWELRFILYTQDGPMYKQQFPMFNSIWPKIGLGALFIFRYSIFYSDYLFQRFCNIWVSVTPADNYYL